MAKDNETPEPKKRKGLFGSRKSAAAHVNAAPPVEAAPVEVAPAPVEEASPAPVVEEAPIKRRSTAIEVDVAAEAPARTTRSQRPPN